MNIEIFGAWVAVFLTLAIFSFLYKDNPFYQDCVDFCEKWDQTSFDPDYPTQPLEYFEPMVRKVLTAPKHTWE